ncbi:MAG: HAD family hydrolase [Anditalea sp.]
MDKKAIIYDFDNTIYAVKTIGEEIFAPLFKLIADSGDHKSSLEKIKEDIMGKPFQVVAANHHFSKELTQKGIDMLKGLTYEGEIKPFDDYGEIKKILGERFLVTTGFWDLQWSKIRKMNIERDFSEIHVVDPSTSTKTKKDVFRDIMERKGYKVSEVLVVGDDPDSEIKAALELGIETVLFDRYNQHTDHSANFKITNFKELKALLKAV